MSHDRRVLVAVHDVAPEWVEEVRWLLARLDELRARPRCLFVIPNHRGTQDVRQHRGLIETLRSEVGAGSEVVLHGYTHRTGGPPVGSAATRARALAFARDAAEFATIGVEEQRQRLSRGVRALQELGLDISTFCPPGWLHTPELPGLLREARIRGLVEMLWLMDAEREERLMVPWTGYVGAGGVNEGLAALGSALLSPLRARSRAVTVFLHPQRARSSAACARALRILERMLRDRRPVTYRELLG